MDAIMRIRKKLIYFVMAFEISKAEYIWIELKYHENKV
jgi:hypothetical protein